MSPDRSVALKRSRPMIRLRFRKNDPEHNLLAAVQAWVLAKGGVLSVVGGVEVQDWNEGAYNFRVAVRCTGTKPERVSAN